MAKQLSSNLLIFSKLIELIYALQANCAGSTVILFGNITSAFKDSDNNKVALSLAGFNNARRLS
jgi:hypothetical protein